MGYIIPGCLILNHHPCIIQRERKKAYSYSPEATKEIPRLDAGGCCDVRGATYLDPTSF